MSNIPPLIEVPIAPTTESDREKLVRALVELAAEDDSFRFSADRESPDRIIIAGMGELHLDNKLDILKRVYQVNIHIGAPQVAYRESISRRVTKDYAYKKQRGGSGQFARLEIVCEPLPAGGGFRFEAKTPAGALPQEYIAGVEKGVGSVSGVLAGFPVVDLKVTLIDGAYHDTDSSTLTFEIAARAALSEALRDAGPVLLEPVMTVVVRTPAEHAGAVIRDLNTRRGTIQRRDMRGDAAEIHATVPLVPLFGYCNNLAVLTRGQAKFEMRYSHYAPVPRSGGDEPFPPAIGMRA
jgi:elongation factor G